MLSLLALLTLSELSSLKSDFVREPMMVGFDCNLAYEYRQFGKAWKVGGRPIDLMRFMSLNGSSWIRVGITTNATGTLSLDVALKSIEWARESAIMIDVFFYLSSVSADLGKQPAPIGWEGKTVGERASLAREHLKYCVETLIREDATDHFYEVGNEIDYGICGSFLSDQTKWPETPDNIEFLKSTVWSEEALILGEAIAGLKEADPNAEVTLHLSHWWNLTFCLEFFDFMRSKGVAFDHAGMSYYPSSGIYDLGEFLGPGRETDADRSATEFRRTVTGLIQQGYSVIVCEFAYPCTQDIPGPFAFFDKQLSAYPLDPDGQARFIADTLLWLYDQQSVVGAFYFAPHFYETSLSDVWGAFALFDENGEARPGAYSIGRFVLLESELVAQLDARDSLTSAWDAIELAEMSGRTEGLSEAKQKAEEAWVWYLSGMFGRATRLASEASEMAEVATNPTIRGIFIVVVAVMGLACLTGVAIIALWMFQRLRRPKARPPFPPG